MTLLRNKEIKVILSLFAILSLTSCEQLDYEHFDDHISIISETKDYGLAQGQKAFYIYWGEMHLKGANVIAGTAVAIDHRFQFPIVELLKKYPQCRNKKSLKAAAAQVKTWQRHRPHGEYVNEY